jgi:hypothetical protein
VSQTLDSNHHRLNHECDRAADVDVDMVVNMYVYVADDFNTNSPCFNGPVSNGPNILGLLIISIQPIF